MKIATLGIVLQDGKVLLGEKKKGEIGTGVLSGPGGKLDRGETLPECLIRETREELDIELDPTSFELTACIIFHRGRTRFARINKILNWFGSGTVADFKVFVYRARILRGEIRETADMIPAWYPLDALPYERMFDGDRHWFPKVASGEKFCANVYYHSRARDFDRIEFLPFVL